MRAIVVGAQPLGEADVLVRLLSRERGRTSAVARAARRSRRRFAGLLEPGTRLEVVLRRGRGSLERLVEADAVALPAHARTELERIALLAYGCELCSALAPEDQSAARLCGLLEVWLDLLEGDRRPPPAAVLALEAKALTFAGLAPTLTICAVCGAPLEDPAVFDAASGGALHARCGGGRSVETAAVGELERLRRTPLAEVVAARSAPPTRLPRAMLLDFVRYQLGRDLRSHALLDELGSDVR